MAWNKALPPDPQPLSMAELTQLAERDIEYERVTNLTKAAVCAFLERHPEVWQKIQIECFIYGNPRPAALIEVENIIKAEAGEK